ncbi:flagellar basal-body MS-ring/collar protein FliF [Metapseudomonas resinovorans]|uniref:Flagellar M-ring protein n=1 Tax=Metapseudomonas resinovorans NBRC 106553 TaxID=1245471 RepID=S6AM80_METRE|nr:flagellar basal-body MS-ring/collar protein FliF [Pseudomonas resinovorans]BAN49945.1 flagellar basal body M-ring protein [Pseudomonas resinovorans NBRC 106553]
MLQLIKSKLPEGGFKPDPRLTLLAMAGAAALLAVGTVFWLWRDQGAFKPLYGAGEAFPAAEVMQVLDTEGLAYRIHPQSGQVLVSDQDLARARMLLAAKGVKVSVPPGYELFDKDEPLGTSQFVQDVRLKRSLEGELARTIMAVKGVKSARIHLAQEEATSFVVNRRSPPKASVMLTLDPGTRLKPEQVGAIANLVANSVPQLKPEDVSVVDQLGSLLSRGLNAWGGPGQNWEVIDDYQQKAVANVEEVLAPVLGAGNYRISVAADMDFSQKEETFQAYGETPRMRSEVQRNEATLDQLALGVPGSLSNRPPPAPPQQPQGTPAAQPGQPQAGNSDVQTENKAATSTRNETTRQNDFDQSVTHIRHASYALRRQSVAVVLNAATAPEGGWTPDARAQLEATVKSAVGFDAQRGDELTLSVFPFTQPVLSEDTAAWWESGALQEWIKLGLLGLVSLLLLLLVVRPAVRHLTRTPEAPMGLEALDSPEALAALPRHEAERLLGRSALAEQGGGSVFGELNPLSEIRLPAPGSGLELQIEHLQMLAHNDPERVSEVIKHWIGRNERSHEPA